MAHAHELGVGAESFVHAEHPVADVEAGHLGAALDDDAGELGAEDPVLGAAEPAEEADEPRAGEPEPAVGPIHRGRVDLDEHLVGRRNRAGDLVDPQHVGVAVPIVDRGAHGRSGRYGQHDNIPYTRAAGQSIPVFFPSRVPEYGTQDEKNCLRPPRLPG